MNWSAIAAIFLALAVGLGAFGAHGLRSRLNPEMMDIYKTAVLYHFLHALGMLMVSVLPKTGTFSESGADTICWLLLAGILIFCGSLYLLAVTGTRMLGAITPIGGVAFMAAWVMLAWKLMRR
jgi:uncharacterized membrane protein YgdD (TMEM256/DUF423 family)